MLVVCILGVPVIRTQLIFDLWIFSLTHVRFLPVKSVHVAFCPSVLHSEHYFLSLITSFREVTADNLNDFFYFVL